MAVDPGQFAKASDVAAMAAAMPTPATSVAPNEGTAPTVGTPGKYRPADAIAPRISRTGTLTVTGASGMISAVWATPLPSGYASYPVFFTPTGNAGEQPVKCKVITSTAAGFSGQCFQESGLSINLSALTAAGLGGLTLPLNTPAPAGTTVFALALPATQ